MKHRFTRLIATGILFSNLLTALLPILPVSATTNNYSVQNAPVTYTTKGGEAGERIVQEFESLAWINWWFVEFEIPTDVEILSLGYRQSGYHRKIQGDRENQ